MRAANILCWRHGRSLLELLETIKHLEAVGVDLYIDPQNIGTTTPMGKLLFQITGAFAEFERTMIKTRVRAGMQTVKDTLAVTASSLAGRDWHCPHDTPIAIVDGKLTDWGRNYYDTTVRPIGGSSRQF